MSKKIAEGTAALVLDVKFGSGAFLKDIEQSRELARTMVELGEDAGVATSALLTNMNVPLGLAIGNANEVRESVEVLAGGGPADVVELTVALAREMLALAGQPDADVEAALDDGRAMDTWRAMITAQGGDPDAALPVARETHVVTADRDGVLVEQQALPFGIAAWRLGAGRARKQDPVQHAAGIDLHAKPGDTVTEGQPLFTLSADEPARFARALEALDGAYRHRRPRRRQSSDGGPLIAERIGGWSPGGPRAPSPPRRRWARRRRPRPRRRPAGVVVGGGGRGGGVGARGPRRGAADPRGCGWGYSGSPIRSSASTTSAQNLAWSRSVAAWVVQSAGAGARKSATVMPRVSVPVSSMSRGTRTTSITDGSITSATAHGSCTGGESKPWASR